jgi:MoxR-like ATPase
MLLNAGKAHAAIREREYALPADIKAILPDVLRHRLVLNTDAVLSDRSIESVVDDILGMTPAPEAQLDVPQPDEQSLAGGETAGAEATKGADD